jgi:hypothetical protein
MGKFDLMLYPYITKPLRGGIGVVEVILRI